MKTRRYLIYVDGGARGNPGPAGIGIVICDTERKKVREVYKYIGEATNNVAEYSALICGLEEALTLDAEEIVVHMDSELIAKQLSGEYRVKNADLKLLFDRATEALRHFSLFEIKHINRSKNKEADKLVNKAINLASLF